MKSKALSLAAFLAITFLAPLISGPATAGAVRGWYTTIQKPDWTPPSWIFGPVWTILYAMMAVAAWMVWRRGGRGLPMIVYGVQLTLNAAWSLLFFGLKRPDLAALEIVALWLAIIATIVVFWKKSATAGALLLPYLAWVTFATGLNIAIWRLNP